MTWTIFVYGLGSFLGVLSAIAGVYTYVRARYGRPWRLVIGEPADPRTGAPAHPGIIALVYGQGEHPGLVEVSRAHTDQLDSHTEMLQTLTATVARVERQVTPNGGESPSLGDTVKRTEQRLVDHLEEATAAEQRVATALRSVNRRLSVIEKCAK